MFFYDCELDYVPDDGQNDVKDGSVENYPLDWDVPGAEPAADPGLGGDASADIDAECTPDDALPADK